MAAPARFDGVRSRAGDNADDFDDRSFDEIDRRKVTAKHASTDVFQFSNCAA
jgi:hypothetical protein